MKRFVLVIGVLGLAGCSTGAGLLDGKSGVPQASNVPVGNNLALPPDLTLATPAATTDAYQPNGPVAQPIVPKPTKVAALSATAPSAGNLYGNSGAAAAGAGDVFDQYGISKINPDGSKKTPVQLNNELRAAIVAKKRLTNPGYGTIANIGSVFNDQ